MKLPKQSEEGLYRAIVGNCHEGVLVVDIKTRKKVFANNAMCKMMGYSFKEILQDKTLLYREEDEKERLNTFNHAIVKGKNLAESIPLIKKDGKVVYCNIRSSQVKIGKRRYLVSFFEDITEKGVAETNLRRIIDASSDSIVVLDMKGRLMDCNARFVKNLHARSKEDLLGKSIMSIIPMENPHVFKRTIQRMIAKGKLANTPFCYNLHGERKCVDVSISILKDNLGKPIGFVGVAHDITSMLKVEDALKESEEKYRELFEGSNDAIMLLDEKGFFDCNAATLKMFRCMAKKEFCGKHPGEWSPKIQPNGGNSILLANKRIKHAFRHGRNYFEWTHMRADGTIFPADVLLTPVTIKGKEVLLATVRDISKRKKMEESLKESEERFRRLFNNIGDAIFIADTKTRRLVDCNRKAESLSCYSRKELLSMHADRLHPKDKVEKAMEGFSKQVAGKGAILETEILTKYGMRIPVEINSSIFIFGGKAYLLGIFRDIRERKKAEEIIKNEVERLRELNEAKNTFLNVVSHELKTPLTAIAAHLRLLEEMKKHLPHDERSSMDALERNSTQLKVMIDNILDIARIQSGAAHLNIQRVDIEDCICKVAKNLKPIIDRKRLKLIMKIGKLPKISADRENIKHILNNLIGNAIKFTEKGAITVSARRQNGRVVIKVADTGIGIAKDNMRRLFERFYQIDSSLKRKYGGTGLGLAITKELVRMHGGDIVVKSILGKGSTFIVKIPIKRREK